MYGIEVWEKNKSIELESTKRATKGDLEAEVEELNKLVTKEQAKFLPVKYKYRVKKIKNEKSDTGPASD